MVERERPPLPFTFHVYTVKYGDQLPLNVKTKLVHFGQLQFSKLAHSTDGKKQLRSKRIAAINTRKAVGNFLDYLDPTNPRAQGVSEGLLITVTDDKDDIIGFTSAVIEHGEPNGIYVGVDQDIQYRRRRLGQRLVLLRSQLFLQKGISSYHTHLWERSLRMYKKLGFHLQKISRTPDEIPLDVGDSHYKISLNQEQISRVASSLGVTLKDNLLNKPITISVS